LARLDCALDTMYAATGRPSIAIERLIRDAAKKIFLILDNPRVHHAKVVQQWLAENADKIEVFYLPSYSP